MNLGWVVALQPILEFSAICEKFQGAFGNMRKRAVSKIMNQRREPHQPAVFVAKIENLTKLPCNVKNAERVIETGVECSGVHQVGEGELTNTPKPLKDRRFNDLRFIAGQRDETVNWISNSACFAHSLQHLKHFSESSFE
jgi:hypothetical protein